MSTVIHQGFLMKEISFTEINEVVKSFKDEVRKIAQQRFDTFLTNVVSEDKRSISEEIKISTAFNLWMKRREEIQLEGKVDPFVDISCELIFIPIEYNNQKYLLGMVFTKLKEAYSQWLKVNGVSEYYYDDRSEKPDEISDEDWEFNKILAEKITHEPICEQGFSISIISKSTVFPMF